MWWTRTETKLLSPLLRGQRGGREGFDIAETVPDGLYIGRSVLQKTLWDGALEALKGVVEFCPTSSFGQSWPSQRSGNHRYNVGAVVKDGRILACPQGGTRQTTGVL
jgi:hypothetical protein